MDNVWYDYAEDRGGKLLALCIELKKFTPKEAVKYFNEEYKGTISTAIQRQEHFRKVIKEVGNDESHILKEIFPVKNTKLWDYLRERKIDFDVARKYLKEIHYMENFDMP